IVSVLQDAPTNYETDLFSPIIKEVEAISGKCLGENPDEDIAMKVIADHSRASAFLIGDGILPSNEGRGYVLRRIMRRAIRYGRNIGLTQPFLHRTSRAVFDVMAPAYPELKEADAFISNVIENEEKRFSETLDNGLKLLGETLSDLEEKGETAVPGDVIFKLYDTYGFPVDIVRDVVRDRKMTLDMQGFDTNMDTQRAMSRSKTSFTAIRDAYKNLSAKDLKYIGYDTLTSESKVVVIVRDGHEVPTAEKGEDIEIVVETTPFYGESGGQVGDTGTISGDGVDIDVTDTIKDPTGLIIHNGIVKKGRINKGDTVLLQVSKEKRNATALNHTATHILHAALGKILGDHVKQAGSLVSPERLRFDFSHFSGVDQDTLNKIEIFVNDRIRQNIDVKSEIMDADEAFKTGATALFEEKYGEKVRVISLSDFSKEFCGGCHTDRTGNIGLFKIISESSVAAGVRRIEALSGASALSHIQDTVKIVAETANVLKEKPGTIPERIRKIIATQKALEKETEQLKAKMALMSTDGPKDEYKNVDGIKVLARKVTIDKPGALRDLADKFRDKIQSGIVVLGAAAGKKALLIVVVTKDLTDKYHAGNIVKQVAKAVGGGGGGRPDMAQAGGTKPENLDQALEKVYEIIKEMGKG
ncbi:MAG: alanine--tRNA ligase, partial [Desulfobacterales bacterium]|nr:alanine--tRNA ligase [Desulfobacterales bacterium]